MIADRMNGPVSRVYALDAALRTMALSDTRGVPLAGRSAELAALRAVGARDLSLGRIFEGHLNGAQLVARCGTAAQRDAAERAIGDGLLFGVWNTQGEAPVRLEPCAGGFVMHGAKTWTSGAGSIARAIITAELPDGPVQMCLIPMDRVRTSIDASGWRPHGMLASDSFTVDFTNVLLSADDLIGAPDDYEVQPWFYAGALRFAAVQTGAIDRLVDETIAYLRARGRDGDPFQCARIAEMRIADLTARQWLASGALAWQHFDREPSGERIADVLEAVDMARTVVERAALETIENAVRCVGAQGLVEPQPFGGLVRDLQMYLRQPAPDAALLRVGRAAFERPPHGRAELC